MTIPTPSHPLPQQLFSGFIMGTILVAATAIPVNAFNGVCVRACRDNITSFQAMLSIYRNNASCPSPHYYLNGMKANLIKEMARLPMKTLGLTLLKPELERHFLGKNDRWAAFKAHMIFSSLMSMCEMVVQPADTLCTMIQAEQKVTETFGPISKSLLFRNLYSGALATGFRQLGYWSGYSVLEQTANSFLEKHSKINPHSDIGIIVKSWPQAVILSAPIHIFHRLKTELQIKPSLRNKAAEEKKRCYKVVTHEIISSQGLKGLARGFFAKASGNSFLIMGVSKLLELGRVSLESRK
jgi:hypothetical protein